MKVFLKKNFAGITILGLLIIGGFLRFYNLNWDQGRFFNPDERNIANAVSRIRFFNQLNPDFFAYGGFLIYLYKALGELLVKITDNPVWVYDWGHINIIGRSVSAFFSTITVIPLFFLAKKIFNREIGLFASALYVFTVSSIQIAHYSITENFLILSTILLCLLSLQMIQTKPKLIQYSQMAVISGLAIATKITALSFLIFSAITQLIISIKYQHNFVKLTFFFSIFIILGLLTFITFSPYTFLRWDKFIESMSYEADVAMGVRLVPYILQFTNTTPYLFQIKNLFWQIGPIFIFSILGFFILLSQLVKTKNPKLFIFLSFPVLYFIYVGQWHTKFIRFMVPILPFLIILSSYALFYIRYRNKFLGNLLIVSFLTITIFWALAFFSIYTAEQTRISASRWIYNNIPAGSKLLGEHWDDGLPIELSTGSPNQYKIEQLTIYEPDNQDKIKYFADELSSADYIIINSRRLYGSIMKLPDKYPFTNKYYKLLFNGELGYREVSEFTSYPSIFGIEINDDTSEETFQVYDHPKVIIFKNVERLSDLDIKHLLSI